MKKLLITTTAIIGASMIAATAHAEKSLSVGGGYTSSIYLGGDDTTTDSMTFAGSTFSININASRTTDTGLTLSAATHLDGGKHEGAASWDGTSAAIAAGFGTISFSNDGSGAAGVNSATGLSVSWNSISDEVITGLPLQGTTDATVGIGGAGIGASNNTVTYTSPNINGLTVGYTMAENGGNSESDVSKGETSAAKGEGHVSYSGFGIKYNMAGLSVAYASASQTNSHTVKGWEDTDAGGLGDYDNDPATPDTTSNGKYSESWSGTAVSVGYTVGGFSVGYSSVTKEHDPDTIAGVKAKELEDVGAIANRDTNETAYGLSYNYGAGTVSYVSASEDVGQIGDDEVKGDISNTILAVSHDLANGITVGFEQHSANVETDYQGLDADEAGTYEAASENIITIGLNF